MNVWKRLFICKYYDYIIKSELKDNVISLMLTTRSKLINPH